MFTSPIRQVLSVRRGLNPGLLAGAASVSALLSLTPLVLPLFVEEFAISVAVVGWASSAQIASFAVASFLAGRFLPASNRLFRTALIVLASSNALAAFAPSFTLLVVTRIGAGVAAGIVNWLAWRQAARVPTQMGSVAVIGPATAAVASIVLGFLIASLGYGSAYLAVGVVSLAALALPIDIQAGPPTGRAVSPSRSNVVLLLALGLITCFGSSIFLLSGFFLGADRGGPPWLLAWALAGSAGLGIVAARQRMSSGGIWFLCVSAMALVLGLVPSAWVGAAAVTAWGLFFWFGIPAVLRLVDDYSDQPGERSGDIQASMAVGRVIGPLVGGALLGAGSPELLGVVSAAGLGVGAVLVLSVERYRRTANA
ncbi:MAG: MFS transporter [Acidimicrobiia bacterium]|nr:MFS transporter [Acidimicrobiia bacterium]